MPFVVDASVTACWLMPDEMCPIATAAYQRLAFDTARVPSLWWFEIRNMLVVNERRGRIDAAVSDRALALLGSLPIQIDRSPEEVPVLSLARRHRLTIYDAAYLELALRENIPLASLDTDLTKAARTELVELLDV